MCAHELLHLAIGRHAILVAIVPASSAFQKLPLSLVGVATVAQDLAYLPIDDLVGGAVAGKLVLVIEKAEFIVLALQFQMFKGQVKESLLLGKRFQLIQLQAPLMANLFILWLHSFDEVLL